MKNGQIDFHPSNTQPAGLVERVAAILINKSVPRGHLENYSVSHKVLFNFVTVTKIINEIQKQVDFLEFYHHHRFKL